MERWTGRVAVVTGASSGIGAEVTKVLVRHGMVVVGIARRDDRIKALAKELKGEKGTLHAVKADLKNEKEILDAFTWIENNTNGIDVLVNNAGAGNLDTLLDGSTDAWRSIFDLNVLGLSICAREAVKSMKKKGADDGIIINVNSILGHQVLFPMLSMYTASKFAVRALSESLHKELAASGSHIRVTNLSPGAVATEFNDSDGMKNYEIPMNREDILQPSHLAQTVVFILSLDKRAHVPELTILQNIIPDPSQFVNNYKSLIQH